MSATRILCRAPTFARSANCLSPLCRNIATTSLPPLVAIPALSTIGKLWNDFILWAVPKSKVTPSRKRMRGYHRTPKQVQGYSMCKECGQPTLRHRLCVCWEPRLKPTGNGANPY
mmetsp:Transcript_45692/g.103164  ORF Transcript_45692/g.103164 Transcript_45692/m.103164 type:complete len:115 (-) Transcript_45692:334-678(-)